MKNITARKLSDSPYHKCTNLLNIIKLNSLSPREKTAHPHPTMAGVFGCTLMTLGAITRLLRDWVRVLMVMPAITEMNSFESKLRSLED